MKIGFFMLVSPVEERIANACNVKKNIPSLNLINIDAEKQDLWDAHLDILKESVNCCDGIVMMEDDIILCRDFLNRMKLVLMEHQNDPVQFFERALAKTMPSRGYQNGANFFSCVCYYVPASIAKLISDQKTRDEFRYKVFPKKHEPWGYPIDTYIAYVLKKHKIKYWRESPYLVQHQDFKSTIGARSTKRQSMFFIDDLERDYEIRNSKSS